MSKMFIPEHLRDKIHGSLVIFIPSVVKKYASYTGYDMNEFDASADYLDCISELCELSHRVTVKESIMGHGSRQRWIIRSPYHLEMIVEPLDRDFIPHPKPICLDVHFKDWDEVKDNVYQFKKERDKGDIGKNGKVH